MTLTTDHPILTAAEPGKLPVAGVFDDIPMDAYHRDPVPGGSLSHSGAKKLLAPSCPAKFRYEQDHAPVQTDAMEFGTAVHTLVLGSGPTLVEVKWPSWRSQAAQIERIELRVMGNIPLLSRDYARAKAMAKAVRDHPEASALFDPERGKAEQTLIWQDERTGVWRRARPDWLGVLRSGRPAVTDLKTCAAADPDSLRRAIADYGYNTQEDWYLDGVKSLGIAENPDFLFVFVEKEPPYLITISGIEPISKQIAAAKNRRALDVFAACRAADRWPAYVDDVIHLDLPGWVESRDASEYLT